MQAFMKIFCMFDNAVVRDCQFCMDFLSVRYVIDIRTVNFLAKYIDPDNMYKTLIKRSKLELNPLTAK